MSIFDRIFKKQIEAAVRGQLAVIENSDTFLIGTRSLSQSDRDRYSFDREEILDQALEAWRVNPLARRIVELTTQYIVGGGLSINCKGVRESKFLDQFWNHRLNRMSTRVYEMADELTRTGNLFVLLSTDAAGMSYLRIMPASHIEKIVARPNDIEQPLLFIPKADIESLNPDPISAYDPLSDSNDQAVILHYTINRPAGAQWGESDLAPLLVWLSRYSNWLQDRARLNRFRNAFLYIVQAKFASEAQRKARQNALNAAPPQPGSILVADENEEWKVLSPRLESADAEKDGLALKKMISAGAGIPLHFLAEPESATRTTAESAGGPTFRRYEQRQEYFLWLLHDVMAVILARRARVDQKLNPAPEFTITGSDISSRDNGSLAQAAYYMINVLGDLKDRDLIANDEFLRVIYRFFGESLDAEAMLEKAKQEIDLDQGKLPAKPAATPGAPGNSDFAPIDDGHEDKTPIPKVEK
jgi:hypothetical protein